MLMCLPRPLIWNPRRLFCKRQRIQVSSWLFWRSAWVTGSRCVPLSIFQCLMVFFFFFFFFWGTGFAAYHVCCQRPTANEASQMFANLIQGPNVHAQAKLYFDLACGYVSSVFMAVAECQVVIWTIVCFVSVVVVVIVVVCFLLVFSFL